MLQYKVQMLNTDLNNALRSVISVLLEMTGHVKEAEELVNFYPSSKKDLDEWLERVQLTLGSIQASKVLGNNDSPKIEYALDQLAQIRFLLTDYQFLNQLDFNASEVQNLRFNEKGPSRDDFTGYQVRAMRYLERAA